MASSTSKSAAHGARMGSMLRPSVLTMIVAAGFFALPQPAAAQFFDGWSGNSHRQRHYRSHQGGGERQPARSEDKQEAVKKPEGLLYAVVSIADQHVTFYDANGVWARSTVSTGVEGHPTPTGVFTILEKERWHHSNIYSGAPMPYMNRITWTGVAMHEGVVTGHPASHGCIRLPGDFARKLFGVTIPGERVIVSAQEVLPVEISHPNLPVAKLLPAPSAPFEALPSKPVENVALATGKAEEPAPKLLNPLDFAKALKAAAEAKIKSAAAIKKAAVARLDAEEQQARISARDLAAAWDLLRKAKSEADDAAREFDKAQGEEAVQKAQALKSAADARLAESGQKLAAARDAHAANEHQVQVLEDAVRNADTIVPAASNEVKEAERRLEPVSIFISRKTGRLYVRQATKHLLEVPVTVRDPDRPIGTHLFIATGPGDNGSSLRWVSLTPPAAAEVIWRHHYNRGKPHPSAEEEIAPVAPFPETAKGALDRIEIPAEAADLISNLLWTGGTLIISDVGMSGEGRFAMDFQILTRTVVHEY